MKLGEKKKLQARFNDAPERFDIDVARLVQDTLDKSATKNLKEPEISNPTNLPRPTAYTKDESRAGKKRISANFLGLIGPVSSLPSDYTHAAILERKRRSSSLFDFLELFAAELRIMFIDAHRKYRLPSLFQLYRTGSENRITASVFALMGFGTKSEREKLSVDREIPLYYSGFFTDRHRTAISLELMLSDFTGMDVDVQQFFPRRLRIEEDEQTKMDPDLATNSVLGQTAVAGATSLNRTGSLRVTIGPLNYSQYLSLMPSGSLYDQVVELIRLYCGASMGFDIQLVLHKDAVPQTRLDPTSGVGRLGWDTWALNGNAKEHSRDAIFDPEVISSS